MEKNTVNLSSVLPLFKIISREFTIKTLIGAMKGKKAASRTWLELTQKQKKKYK